MKHKKLIKKILLTVCSVVLIFFASFMIGSDFGEHPLFFLNTKTVKQVISYSLPLKDDITVPYPYMQATHINTYKDKDAVISFKNYKNFKYSKVIEFQLKFLGNVKIIRPFDFSVTGCVTFVSSYAFFGRFIFELKE